MSITGIQGQTLEVTVVRCRELKGVWTSRDTYVCLEYASTKLKTSTCTDGGKNPLFQEKFVFPLIEGLTEINATVWDRNTYISDDFIGGAEVKLDKALSEGFDNSAWPLQTKTGSHAGEVKLKLFYQNAQKSASSYAPSAPQHMATPNPQEPQYSAPHPASYPPPPSVVSYPPPPSTAYPSSSPYPSYSSAYPPPHYPPPPTTYPPHPYPHYPLITCIFIFILVPILVFFISLIFSYPHYPPPPPPSSAYPPPPYPPPQPDSTYHAPGPYPGMYPPPPY